MYEVVEDGPLDQVSVGLDYACAIRSSDRSVTCWTTTGTMASPVLQPPEGEFASIATGDFNACGTLVDGSLVCWGEDLSGALDTPPGRFEQVATGEFSSCAVGSTGNACWGGFPPLQPPADHFKVLSAAAGYACGILEDGSISCWGDAPAGSLPGGPFRALSTATGHACAVRMDGTLACWGELSVSQVPPEGLVAK